MLHMHSYTECYWQRNVHKVFTSCEEHRIDKGGVVLINFYDFFIFISFIKMYWKLLYFTSFLEFYSFKIRTCALNYRHTYCEMQFLVIRLSHFVIAFLSSRSQNINSQIFVQLSKPLLHKLFFPFTFEKYYKTYKNVKFSINVYWQYILMIDSFLITHKMLSVQSNWVH